MNVRTEGAQRLRKEWPHDLRKVTREQNICHALGNLLPSLNSFLIGQMHQLGKSPPQGRIHKTRKKPKRESSFQGRRVLEAIVLYPFFRQDHISSKKWVALAPAINDPKRWRACISASSGSLLSVRFFGPLNWGTKKMSPYPVYQYVLFIFHF